MSKFENDYKRLLSKILEYGTLEPNRTGVDCITLAGEFLQIDMSDNLLPIITGKKVWFEKAYHEFVWFIEGMTTTKYLNDNGIKWWDKFAKPNGDLGKTYGYQLRNYNGYFDQLDYVCNELKRKTRRAHITLWNPSELKETSLPCCYTGFTFVVTGNGSVLNMSMEFRSSDAFLGLPYDILVGALLMRQVARFTEMRMGKFTLVLNNVHIYENHLKQIKKYMNYKTYSLPKFPNGPDVDYKSGPYIKAPLN